METAEAAVEIDVVGLGERIYERIKPVVDPGNYGKYLLIDVLNDDYEVGETSIDAYFKLIKRHPQGKRYGIRIGYKMVARTSYNWVPDDSKQ